MINASRVQWQLLKSQRFIEHAKKWGHQTSEQVVFQNGNIPSSLPSKPHNHISKFQIKHGILFQIMNCPVSWNTRQWYYFTKLF